MDWLGPSGCEEKHYCKLPGFFLYLAHIHEWAPEQPASWNQQGQTNRKMRKILSSQRTVKGEAQQQPRGQISQSLSRTIHPTHHSISMSRVSPQHPDSSRPDSPKGQLGPCPTPGATSSQSAHSSSRGGGGRRTGGWGGGVGGGAGRGTRPTPTSQPR